MILGENKFGLQEIWEGVFNIYLEFARICEENHLQHFVSDGSALGAIRHGGFIPWDDDFDVSMPRPDYEKFIELAEKQLPHHLKLVTWRNTSEYTLPFAKIQDSREDYIKKVEANYGRQLSNGIFIDILPIDGAAETVAGRFIADKWFRVRRVLMRFWCDSFSRQTNKGKLCWLGGMFLSPLFPWLWGRRRLLTSYEASAQRYKYDESELTIRPCSNVSYRRRPISREVWGAPREVKFGDAVIKVAERTEEYLTAEYGDYMKPPTEDKQVPTHLYAWRCPWWLGPTDARRKGKMKKLLLVNSVCGIRSTGRIVAEIAKEYEAKGWEVKIAYGRESYVPEACREWAVKIGTKLEVCLHALLARLWGDHAFGTLRSTFATRRFLKWAEAWSPDAIWLHSRLCKIPVCRERLTA